MSILKFRFLSTIWNQKFLENIYFWSYFWLPKFDTRMCPVLPYICKRTILQLWVGLGSYLTEWCLFVLKDGTFARKGREKWLNVYRKVWYNEEREVAFVLLKRLLVNRYLKEILQEQRNSIIVKVYGPITTLTWLKSSKRYQDWRESFIDVQLDH